MRKTRRILSIMLALVLLTGLLPQTALAATDWAYVRKADGSYKAYTNIFTAWDDAVSEGATFGLLHDWDGGRWVVPNGKKVTVELNGHLLTRRLADSKSDGEVFWVGKDSTLIVYGGTKENPALGADISHNEFVYVANADRYGYSRRKETLYGGVINGGNSSDAGGGIHMKEKAKVYLYHVTVAGNRAAAGTVEYGDGGGVEMDLAYGYLYLEDSNICYNCARYDGGGVHVDGDYCRIDMVRSHIDHNVADDNGGGIYVDGDSFSLRGDAEQIMDPDSAISEYSIPDWTGRYNYFLPDALGSSVSFNCVFDSEDGGGGIYMDNETGLIQGVNIIGNITTDDGDDGNGGGIYLDEEQITIRNCNIMRNKADELGGGIYVRGDDNILDRDDNTVDSCTVYKNLARDSGGAGGGIYVYRYCDLGISGPTIVRGNVSKSYSDDNLFLSSDGATINAYLIPATTPGADVHIRFSTAGANGHCNQVSRDPGSYDIYHFSYDNDNAHSFGWNRSWEDRHLKLVEETKPSKPETVTFTPDTGKRTQTTAGGYNGYDLIKGIVSYPSFPDDEADIENVFYYSDGFFDCDTNTYNPQLATASMCLAGAAGYSNEYGKDAEAGSYIDKSQNFRQFVSDIGCADAAIFVNDFNAQKPGADTIGVGIASKPIFGNKTLVIIGVRGMGYESEWISNMTLGASGEAAGWSSAATQVMAELKGYLARKGIDGSSENTLFWIAGYSRAGATSNLTAKRIVDTYDNQGTHTFAYPLEAPMGGVESAKVEGNNYNCIHNVVNQNDIVPWVGTTEMGFIRYGVDHYVPGSPIAGAPSDGTDNNKIPEDNTAWDVENKLNPGYKDQRTKMLDQLTAVNQDILFDDYYQQATIKYIESSKFGTKNIIEETTDHENEIGTTERFIDLFFEKLQEYAFKYGTDGNTVSGYTPRAYFATYPIANGKTFQQAAGAAAGVIFGMPAERKNGLIDSMNGLMDRLDGTSTLYFHLDEAGITGKDLIKDLKNIWKQLTDPSSEQIAKGSRSIRDFMTDEEFKALNDSYIALLFPILCFVGIDYDEYGQDIIGSAAYNIPRIIANHYPEVTHSWLRSYDDLYENDTTPVQMDPAVKTGPSAAAVEIIHDDGTKETVIPDGSEISIGASDYIRLIPSDPADIDQGEALYYRFASGIYWLNPDYHPFTDPLRVSEMLKYYTAAEDSVLVLKVIAAHNGVKLPETELRFKIDGSVMAIPSSSSSEEHDYEYEHVSLAAGESCSMDFIEPTDVDGSRFKCWDVHFYIVDSGWIGAEVPAEKYLEYFGPDFDANSPHTTVTNCMGVNAIFIPVYDTLINNLTVSFEGDPSVRFLPAGIKWKAASDDQFSDPYDLFWSYDPNTQRYTGEFSFPVSANEELADPLNASFVGLEDYGLTIENVKTQIVSGQKALFSVEFTPVDPEATKEAYDSPLLVFYIRDVNLSETDNIKEYRALSFSERVAPFVEDMEFVSWQGGITSPTISITQFYSVADIVDNRYYAIAVYYRPIVKEVDVTFDKRLTAGESLPELSNVRVTITNEWQIDNAVLTWEPSGTTADYETIYTAHITANKEDLTGTILSGEPAESVALNGKIAFAENITVRVADPDGNPIAVKTTVFSQDEDAVYLDLFFDRTGKQPIVRFADVEITVPHGSTAEDILDDLPTDVYAYLEDGRMVSVPVQWTGADSFDPDVLDAQSIHAYGCYAGDEYAVAEGVSLTANVTVLAVDQTGSPAAMPATGEYTGLQRIWLEADDGATIRYALTEPDAEGEDPDAATLSYSEYTEPVILNEYGKTILLYAYAEKEGLRDSSTVTFRYELTKPEVTKLEAKSPMIAEDGNIECWYSTRQERTGYDDSGEPVYENVPDRYYADADCTVLLDYEDDVLLPAFVRTSHKASPDDAVAQCIVEDGNIVYEGLELLGVQAIGDDGAAARVLTVLDSRIIENAADYGYLFASGDADLTVESASYRYSCKDTGNTLFSGDPGYSYVTARIENEFLDPGMNARFYVRLGNGTDYIYSTTAACTATIDGSANTDAAEDNITAPSSLNYTVTASATEGGPAPAISAENPIPYGTNVTVTAGPANDGFVFTGWYQNNGKLLTEAETYSFTVMADTVLEARYRAKTYTVRYHANGGSGAALDTQRATYGVPFTVRENSFTRTGYTAAGWNTEADGSGIACASGGTAQNLTTGSAVTLFAQWTPNNYSIVFNANGGTGTMADQAMTYNVFAALEENAFTRTGYSFAGWNTARDGSGTAYADKKTVRNLASSGSVALYAQWTPNTYTIILVNNGGVGNAVKQRATYDLPIALPTNTFTRTGYTFKGWNTAADGSGTPFIDMQIVKNLASSGTVRLYAQWKAKTYIVRYYANGGSGEALDYQRVTYDKDFVLRENTFTRTGYSAAGWNTALDGTGITYASGQTVQNLTTASAISLFAKWKANKYTVVFDANGGTGTMVDQTMTYNASAALRANTYTRAGYTFMGWNTTPDGSGTAYTNGRTVKNLATQGTVTLYAQWKPNTITVRFYPNGGSGSMDSQTMSYDTPAALNANKFTRAGYTFAGWKTSGGAIYGDGEVVENLAYKGVINLYAQWTR